MKRGLFLLWFVLVFLSHAPENLFAQKLHLIMVTDNDDKIIGSGCQADFSKIMAEVHTIADAIGYAITHYNVVGSSFIYENMVNVLDKLSVQPNDIIFFYYSGHGYNEDQRETNWPSMKFPEGFFPFDMVNQKLASSSARLVVSMADCCNKHQGLQAPISEDLKIIETVDENQKKNYANLFLDSKGVVLVASCKRGQVSYTHPEKGSYFTSSFIESLTYAINYAKDLNWETLLTDAQRRLAGLNFPQGPQTPQFFVGERTMTDPPKPSPKPPVVNIRENVSPMSYSSVNEFFNILIDKNIPGDKRRKTMDTQQSIFSDDAFVEIYKGQYFLEPQKMGIFLQRIYLNANLIRKINFIENLSEKNRQGKYRKVAVQEIWK